MKTPNIMESSRFQLSQIDWQKTGKNAMIFLAPALLFFLLELQSGRSLSEAVMSLKLWGINCVIDILRKFIKDNTK